MKYRILYDIADAERKILIPKGEEVTRQGDVFPTMPLDKFMEQSRDAMVVVCRNDGVFVSVPDWSIEAVTDEMNDVSQRIQRVLLTQQIVDAAYEADPGLEKLIAKSFADPFLGGLFLRMPSGGWMGSVGGGHYGSLSALGRVLNYAADCPVRGEVQSS